MKKPVSIKRVSGTFTYELPAAMCREIGCIPSQYSAPLVSRCGYLVGVRFRDTKVSLEKYGQWREDCHIISSALSPGADD